mgnify:CR=1 FL=1
MGQAALLENGAGANPNLSGANAVTVSGNFAYVTGTSNVLQILDITLPGRPVPKGMIKNGDGGAVIVAPKAVVVVGNNAYLACTPGVLEIVDVSDPSKPLHKGLIKIPNFSFIRSLYVHNNYAYLVGVFGLRIIDISDPSRPTVVSSLGQRLSGIYVSQINNQLYAFGISIDDSENNFRIFNIQNPNSPTLVASRTITTPTSIFVAGRSAYISSSGSGGRVTKFNVANPANPVVTSTLTLANFSTTPVPNPAQFAAVSVFVSGRFVYAGGADFTRNGAGSLFVADTLMTHVGNFSYSNNTFFQQVTSLPQVLTVKGNNAFIVGNGIDGLGVADITNRSSPFMRTVLNSGNAGAVVNNPRSVFVLNNYAYVTDQTSRSLGIIDISVPTQPVQISNVTFPNRARGVFVLGQYAYVTTDESTLEIVDVSNPRLPSQVGRAQSGTGGFNFSVPNSVHAFVRNNRIYVALTSRTNNSFVVIDVTNPATPSQVSSISHVGGTTGPYLSQPSDFYMLGTTAYVISQNGATSGPINNNAGSLQIIDLSNPLAPVSRGYLTGVGAITTPSFDQKSGGSNIIVAAKGSSTFAYIADSYKRSLHIVNVTNPATPVLQQTINNVEGLGDSRGIALFGDYAIVPFIDPPGVLTTQGLVAFDVSNPLIPIKVNSFLRSNARDGVLLSEPSSIFVSGNYAYVTNTGLYPNLATINLNSPEIKSSNSFLPTRGPVGTTVTINGNNFDTILKVSINGLDASVTNVTDSTLTITIPTSATIGPIMVSNSSQRITSTTNFIVTPTSSNGTNISQNGFAANWSNVGATRYFLDVSTQSNFSSFVTGNNNRQLGSVTNVAVENLLPGTTYFYRVRSNDGVSTSDNSNTISVTTLPATPVTSAATNANQSGFTVNWLPVSGVVSNYFLDLAFDNQFVNFVPAFNNLNIPANRNSQVVSGLPFGTYYARVRAANSSGSSPSSAVMIISTLDVTPPLVSISANNPSTVTEGNTPTFSATATDDVSIARTEFFYRGIAQKDFKSTLMTVGTNNTYSIQIQADWYDSLGLEYYVIATDQDDNASIRGTSNFVRLIKPSLSLPTLPTGTGLESYRIVSFPYLLSTNNDVSTVYNNVPWNDDTKAGLWWWNPVLKNGSGDYDQFGKSPTLTRIDPGKGYWIITSTPVTPQLTNVPAPNYNRDRLFQMILRPGWNQIGNPYPVAISWDDVIAYNEEVGFSAFGKLNIYDGQAIKEATGGTLLKAFEGGFVKNLTSSDIIIQIPFPGQVNNGRKGITESNDLTHEAWKIFLYIKQSGLANQLGGFGMHPKASVGEDQFDNFNIPVFLNAPEIQFPKKETPNVLYSTDVVNTQRNFVWRFKPNGVEGKETYISWNDMIVPGDQQLYLYDEENLNIIDMSQTSSYSFILSSSSRFKIYYGKEALSAIASEKIQISAPHPNPVTEENRLLFKIALPSITDQYSASVQVFNLQGVTLYKSGKKLTGGIQRLEIELNSDLPSGTYVYQVIVSSGKSEEFRTGKIIKK